MGLKLNIIVPYPNAARMTGIWAFEEKRIDFNREFDRAARCTISFAAVELKEHLKKTLKDCEIAYTEQPEENVFSVFLSVADPCCRSDDYSLIPVANGLRIEGISRSGVLYGTYELLKMQGWKWYAPGAMGTYAPELRSELILPEETLSFTSPSYLGRGFSLDGHLNESVELGLWMARNRLNIYACRPHTSALMHKLGFSLREGGHIFEQMLDPDSFMDDGRTLWEAHPEWFGTPADGNKTKEKAQWTQFCVSQPECLDFLAQRLLDTLMHEWHGADEVNVWGFDTWGSICTCDACKKLGNGADQNFVMLSHFRSYLDRAYEEGKLDRKVRMVLCAYEGTCTLCPPENPIPQNVIDAGDYCLYATIVRCYAHKFDDDTCSYNREYCEEYRKWNSLDKKIPMMVLEYYNVSKFEDLPLLFTRTMPSDFRFYTGLGAAGYNYMHIPMINWGVRTLTQVLYAELSWNPDIDAAQIIADYFRIRYGQYAQQMKSVYEKIEDASSYITSWRAWKFQSLLTAFHNWDGKAPDKPLAVDDHFATPEQFERMGGETEANLSAALKELKAIVREEKHNADHIPDGITTAVNPAELRKQQENAQLIFNLTEDMRNLSYGLDTLRLMYATGRYYNALYQRNTSLANAIWQQVQQAEEKLESYYMPATYTSDYLALISKDGLARAQMKEVIARCRKYRIEQGM